MGWGEFGEERGGGETALGVHAEVEGAIDFEREPAGGVIDLHRGDAEIGEDEIGALGGGFGEEFLEASEVHSADEKGVGGEAEGTEAGFGFGEFEGIGIGGDEEAAGLDGGEEFAGVAAVAEGGVDGDVAGLGVEDAEDFGEEDGAMGTCEGFAAVEDFLEIVGVAIGVKFFIFFGEISGIFS